MLARAIIRSRFPGDTGSARLRQLATVTFILAEHKRGAPPTVTSLAILVDSHRSVLDDIVTALHQRGLVSRTDAPGYHPPDVPFAYAMHNTVLDVRTDAIEAFQDAHLRETGKPLDLG